MVGDIKNGIRYKLNSGFSLHGTLVRFRFPPPNHEEKTTNLLDKNSN